MTTAEWAQRFRYLSSLESGRPGKYSLEVTPYLYGVLEALDDPAVREVVCQKSAQVAWTSGVLGNAIGRWIDIDPTPMLILFPKEGSAKEYMAEKFEPMVEATPRLRERIDLRSRKAQQRQLFKRFPGGFLKLVGSNSPSSVKSTPVPRVAVEEPDDCNLNIRGQGDSIKLAKERMKTFRRSKMICGGTPTIAGLSSIEAEMEISDKRRLMVPCHECGESHELSFEHLHWQEADSKTHPVYGKALPETAYYACPQCGCCWNDDQKNRNVRRAKWVATAPFSGVAGFYLNELYSPFPQSRFVDLVRKKLEAEHEAERGNLGPLIAYVNSSEGKPFQFKSEAPDTELLAARAESYLEKTVPAGGLLLTAGIDVQHDRLALIIRAWGRGEESWLVYWGELPGNTIDKQDEVWTELDKWLFGTYRHASGAELGISAAGIDSSDGHTSDAVYHYVRSRSSRGPTLMAVKGASIDSIDREIFSRPQTSVDTADKRNTKASKYGLRPFMVGTHKAKTWISNHLSLTGSGPGRMHWYKDVRADYYEQLTNEVLAPHPRSPQKRVWQKKAGRRNEALDCEVYALHAARSQKVHTKDDKAWAGLEQRLIQDDFFSSAGAEPTAPPPRQSVREVRMRMGR